MTISKVFLLPTAVAFLQAGCATSSTPHRTEPSALATPPRSVDEIALAAKRDVYWLADDAREGRGLGSDGLLQAGDFIAGRFARFGLKPLPSLGGYFQDFEFSRGNKLGKATTLNLNGTPLPSDQYTGLARSKAGDFDGPLAFAGYGIKATDPSYDDFADVDVTDRVVMIMRWEPVDDEGQSVWEKDGLTRNAEIQRKVSNAANAGAKAVILVNAPSHHDDVEPLMDSQAGLRRNTAVPVFHVTVAAADQILAAANAPTLAELQEKIDSARKPASALFDSVRLSGKIDLEKRTSTVRNVVAYLPGKGPHADEYIVVGAHYDHVGLGSYGAMSGVGKIHNGADDNASGTTAMLQLAENFALAGRQERSIIFTAFTLEELGLIGSRNFVDASPVPTESIVAMLNLDMVGRIKDEHLYVGGSGTAEAFASILGEADDASPITIRDMGKGGRGPSDHQNFSSKKIPVLFFFSGMHPDYHAPGDDPEKINYTGIAQVVNLSFGLVQKMCDMPRQTYVATFDGQQPDVNVVAGGEPGQRNGDREMIQSDRPQLGIVPDYTAEPNPNGVLISGVTDKTAAYDAGLKAGDVITELNSRKIASLEDVVEFINASKVGEKVNISILRDGQPQTLESTLKARAGAQ